jgi:hypothetical protein
VASQRAFWWDRVSALLRQARSASLRLTVDGETRAWADARHAAHHIVSWLQPKAPEIIDQALAELGAWAGGQVALPEHERPLTVDELRGLAESPLIGVQSHTRTHANLRHIDEVRRMEELAGSREDLARWLNIEPPMGVAYPYGTPGADVDRETRASARAAGFDYAMLSTAGAVTADTDRFALPRLAPADVTADAFPALISRAMRPRRR